MAEMTKEEEDALDELWTRTTPKINVSAGGGYFREHQAQMLILDERTARLLNAKASASRQTPEELVAAMVRRELAVTSS